MRMTAGLVLIAASLVLVTAAFGDDDPIAARQALMKRNGAEARTAFLMAKGRMPFDPAAAATAMNDIATDMAILPTLFPPGSDQGKTKASPDVFTNMDDFKALAATMATDAKAAATAAPQGVDAFAAAFTTVDSDCSACHRKYRVR